MGCDIHAVFQAPTEGGWQDVPSDYDRYRHYYLFAALAGVRNNWDLTPIHEPRGLPPDFVVDGDDHPITPEVATEFERQDAEGPLTRWMGDWGFGWLTGDEMLSSHFANDEKLKYFFDEVRRLQAIHGRVRLVFGFDN